MKLYICYEQGNSYYVRQVKGDGGLNNYRRYDRKRFKDFCNTLTIKGDNIINLPEKPSTELSDVLRIEFNKLKVKR